jgi:hypothetical protein
MDLETLSFVILLVGTLLICAEALGEERAKRLENAMKKLAISGRTIFGQVIQMTIFSWRRTSRSKYEAHLENFIAPFGYYWPPIFLLISIASFLFVRWMVSSYGVSFVLGLAIGSYLSLILSTFLLAIAVEGLREVLKAKTWSHILLIVPYALLIFVLGALAISSFFGTLAFSFPAAIIFGIYILLYFLSISLCWMITWKERLKLGSIFLILGAILTLTGIILGYVA